jgi:ribosomal 50S subunit-recycling heat shock protein
MNTVAKRLSSALDQQEEGAIMINPHIKQFSHKPNSNIIDPQPELKINFYDKIIDFRVLKLKRFRD